MRLIKAWLTNKNVIICQDTLAEMHKFALTANNPDDLRDLALEVLKTIPDKVQFILQVVGHCRRGQSQ